MLLLLASLAQAVVPDPADRGLIVAGGSLAGMVASGGVWAATGLVLDSVDCPDTPCGPGVLTLAGGIGGAIPGGIVGAGVASKALGMRSNRVVFATALVSLAGVGVALSGARDERYGGALAATGVVIAGVGMPLVSLVVAGTDERPLLDRSAGIRVQPVLTASGAGVEVGGRW